VPLDQTPIDHVTASEWSARQEELGAAGPDADELEQGVIAGCSPWACRLSQAEAAAGAAQDDFGLSA
jgi:hypothetical protein